MLFANIGPKRASQINNRTQMASTSTKHGTNLAQGGCQGLPTNQRKYKQIKKTQTQNTNMRSYVFFVGRIPQTSEGSTAGRLQMFYKKKE